MRCGMCDLQRLLNEHHLYFLSLTGGCTGSSESKDVKMPHCCKSHVTAHLFWLLKKSVSLLRLKMKKTHFQLPYALLPRSLFKYAYPAFLWARTFHTWSESYLLSYFVYPGSKALFDPFPLACAIIPKSHALDLMFTIWSGPLSSSKLYVGTAWLYYPQAFLKKCLGYCNRLPPSVTLSPPKPLDGIQPNLVCELLT